MLEFKFELTKPFVEDEIDGLSLGDISVCSENRLLSSALFQNMMIFPSISQLLYGIEDFVKNNQRCYEFFSVDSAFGLRFTRDKRNSITINFKDDSIGNITDVELVNSITVGINNFLSKYNVVVAVEPDNFSTEALMRADFGSSVIQYMNFFKQN